MKAMVYQKYGPPDVLELKEVEKPNPRDGEVLVKVHATSINSWDYDLLRGTFQGRLGAFRKPKFNILGCDIAGTIEAVSSGVEQLKSGDNVFGDISGFNKRDWGGFAEYVCARETRLALKPDNMTFEQAAAIPQGGVMALQAINKIQVQPGQKFLMNGAGGAVGTFAVQIAKSLGAEVTGVDSTVKLDMLRSIGADHVIDYTQEDFTKNGVGYDLILDVVCKRSTFHYKRALSPKGNYVAIGGSLHRILQVVFLGTLISKFSSKKMSILGHKPNRKDLNVLVELFEAGKVIPVIDRRFTLNELADAFWHFKEGNFKGKIIITVEHDDNTK
jgi:NADPH:quinone reductase-like Zn-dependent oxidoreductase